MRSKTRSTRRQRRGFASLVSFLLLFAFTLGQGTLAAQAKNPKKAASEETAPDAGAVTDASADVPAEETPAAEAPAEEAPTVEPDAASTNDSAADVSSNDGAAPASREATKVAQAKAGRDTAVAAPAAAAELVGGDIDLDFVAAGPFTYDHATGLGTNPPFG